MPKLTYANVIATLALFLALGGVGYAAVMAPRNSVNSASVRNGSLTGKDIARGSIGPAKLAAPEAIHYVGGSGEPFLGSGFALVPGAPLGFYRGPDCVVHLVGAANGPADNYIFKLPQGFRPEHEVVAAAAVLSEFHNDAGSAFVETNGILTAQDTAISAHVVFGFDSITFRAAGCGS
jgi:hypothetical protein